MKKLLLAAAVLASQGAFAAIVSTGDLGPAIGVGSTGGVLDVHLATPGLDAGQLAKMTVASGLWNAPFTHSIDVELYVNNSYVQTFGSGGPYISDSPTITDFGGIQSLLNDGNNLITFKAVGPESGVDYAIGKVDIEYNAVPEPATLALLGTGVAVMLRRRRK